MKDPAKEQPAISNGIDIEDAEDSGVVWNDDEDTYMQKLVSMCGTHNWEKVALLMRNQFTTIAWSDKECKKRWNDYLDPKMSKRPWTELEELEMLVVHKLCQNKWSTVSSLLYGRNNNTIKNRFYSIFRKVKNKIKRSEFIFNSRIELLEILYMISLMEMHLSQPFQPMILKGKRGKDFIFNLLHNLHMEEIERFKVGLAKRSGKVETLGDLWAELAIPIERIKLSNAENINLKSLEPSVLPGKQKFVLPEPSATVLPSKLTEEEKEFILTQAFLSKMPQPNPCQCKEIMSTGTHPYQPMLISPGLLPLPPLSAGRCSAGDLMQGRPAFQGFTDYTSQSKTVPHAQPIQVSVPHMGMQIITSGSYVVTAPMFFQPQYMSSPPNYLPMLRPPQYL